MRRFRVFPALLCLALAYQISNPALLSSQTLQTASPSDTAQSILALNARLLNAGPAPRAAAMLAGGQSVLQARHDLVIQLIKTHPEEVRSVLLPDATAAEIRGSSDSAAALLEQDTTLSGELIATIADDFVHKTSTKGWHLHRHDDTLGMFGPVDESLMHQQIDAKGIALDDVMAVESTSRHYLDVGATLSGPGVISNAATVTAAAPAVCSTTGPQSVAVLVLNFAGGPSYGNAASSVAGVFNQYLFSNTSPSVNTFWNEASYGKTSAVGDVYGPFTLSTTYDCNSTDGMRTAALAAAKATVDFSKYNHVMLAYPVNSCSFGGLGYIGCGSADGTFSTQNSTTWIPIVPNGSTTSIGVAGFAGNPNSDLVEGASHELGHNLGLNHANTLDFTTVPLGPIDFAATNPGTVTGTGASTATGRITGINTEYADNFDAMAAPYSAAGPYNGQHRGESLGWFGVSDTVALTSAGKTVTLAPVESSSGTRGLRILRDATSNSWIWAEFHQGSQPYAAANFTNQSPNNITTGVQIHYEDGYNQSGTGTRLLDMTPTATTNTQSNNFKDGALAVGKSWSDPYSPWTILTNSVASSGASVTATYDTPCATVTLNSASLPAAAGSGTATVTAPATCAWTAFANASWITLTGANGSGIFSGTGNGTISYTATANAGAQRTTYLTVARQSMPLTQSATNTTVVSVSPAAASLAPGQAQVFTLKLTDLVGLSDVKQVGLYFQGTNGGSSCPVYVVFNGTSPGYFINTDNSSQLQSVTGGSTSTVSNSLCGISGANSTLTVSGTTLTLTFNMTFTKAFGGVHAIQAGVSATVQSTATINVGALVVDATPSITLSPTSGAVGTTAPVTITGVNTGFTSSSVVTVSGSGVTAAAPTVASASSLTANLTIAPTAAVGARTLTVTTGAEVETATFTLAAAGSTKTTLTVKPDNATPFAGGTVVLTATATATDGSAPSGTITFSDTSGTLGTGTLNGSGVATYTISNITAGAHNITASYAGAGIYSSASATTTVTASDFTVAGSTTTLTLAAGAATGNAVTFTVTPGTGGFTTAVAFACSGLPALSSCSFSPATVTPGAATATSTMTITTTSRSSAASLKVGTLALLLLPGMLLFRRRRMRSLLAVGVLLCAGLMLNGCSGSGGSSGGGSTGTTGGGTTGTTAGISTITVTATATNGSATLAHTATVTLTVN